MKPHLPAATVVACVLAAGCSQPLRPDLSSPSGGAPPATHTSSHSPPRVVLQIAGDLVELEASGKPRVLHHQLFYVSGPAPPGAPLDTVPAYGVLENIRWLPGHRGGTAARLRPLGQEIAVDDPVAPGGASSGGRQVFAPGMHELQLTAPEGLGGGVVTVRFMAGFAPETWWAGPDPARWPLSPDGDGRSVQVVDWGRFQTVPAWPPDGRSYFGPDSFAWIPSLRRPVGDDLERRTFYEIHGDRIYARSEGDSVHLGSWVVFCNGGYDKDSKYTPRVDFSDPALPPGASGDPLTYAVLHELGLVGSPIGFRSRIAIRFPDGILAQPPQSGLYPVFDPNSVFRFPRLMGYWPMFFEGKVYAAVRAEDADGIRDPSAASDLVGIADRVDAGGGTTEERLARRNIITFHVRPGSEPRRAGAVTARR